MGRTRRVHTAVAVLVLLVAGALSAASTTAGTTRLLVKPVIGQPVTVPAQPLAGKRFTVAFKVTRSDTGAALTSGEMICDPSVFGKVIRHAESFGNGTARLSFVIPAKAAGKVLKVKLTIRSGHQSATRVSTFRIVQGLSLPSLSIADVSAFEGNTGTTTLAFPVTLSKTSTQTVSVDFATINETATAPTDYTATSGTLTFNPGEQAKTIAVTVVADTIVEPHEGLWLQLSNPISATIANGAAIGAIWNDD